MYSYILLIRISYIAYTYIVRNCNVFLMYKILRCSQPSCRFSVELVFRIQQHYIADFMDQTITRNDVGFDKFWIEIHFGIAFPLLDVRYLLLAFGPRIFPVRHGDEIVPRDAT